MGPHHGPEDPLLHDSPPKDREEASPPQTHTEKRQALRFVFRTQGNQEATLSLNVVPGACVRGVAGSGCQGNPGSSLSLPRNRQAPYVLAGSKYQTGVSTLFTMLNVCSTVKPGCIRKQSKKVLCSFRYKRHCNNCFLAISFYLP